MRTEEKPKEDYPEYINGIPVGEILRSIAGIRYGYVQIFIQDAKVVQVDKLNKTRFDRPRECK